MALSLNSFEKAVWNEKEVDSLIDYLFEHRSEVGDTGGFKGATFNAAAAHIAPHLTHGPAKTGKMCKTKWGSVRFMTCPTILDNLLLFSSRPLTTVSKHIAIDLVFTGITQVELGLTVMQQQQSGWSTCLTRYVYAGIRQFDY